MGVVNFQDQGLVRPLKATFGMMNAKIPQGITVVKDFDRGLPAIPAHAAELNQVWTNLIDNAPAAMGETGTLTLRTGRDGDASSSLSSPRNP